MYILKSFASASLVVKADIIILIILSILIWAAFLNKINRINLFKAYIDSFEKTFWSGIVLEDFYKANKDNLSNPLGTIFASAMHEWELNNIEKISTSLKESIFKRISNAVEIPRTALSQTINKYQAFFLTVASLSPLLGLFGTVCGIMNTFYAIGLEGNSNLTIVAPGVAEALITTAFSIAIAIISAVMYNFFNVKIATIEDRIDNFTIELLNVLSRSLDSIEVIAAPSSSVIQNAPQKVNAAIKQNKAIDDEI
jgi:biopolymer transport protein TolQ